MQMPSYYLPPPPARWDAATLESFARLWDRAMAQPAPALIPYNLAAPKWQFLAYLCEREAVLLHGSGNLDIAEFEPRKALDAVAFGNQNAVYAASDGIWPLYFAIVDRERCESLLNACCRVCVGATRSAPYYFFSINQEAFDHHPWRDGTVYVLPGKTFTPHPRQDYGDVQIEIAQWASLVAVKPLAKLMVTPDDFPFLDQMHTHDRTRVAARARANPAGFPWIDADEA